LFLIFLYRMDVCSQIHEHCEKHWKGNNFFLSMWLFVLLSYLTIFLCSFSLLDECFALRFISTMKYKKGNKFLPSLLSFVLLPYLTFCLCSFSLLDGCFALIFMSTMKNTLQLFFFSTNFCSSTIFNYFSL